MWTAQRETIVAGVEKIRIVAAGRALPFADVLAGWRDDEGFRAFFIAALAAVPFRAFFWEMPPIRRAGLEPDYECVAVRGDTLTNLRADASAFASKLNEAEASDLVVSFRNLGGDALLVIPRPLGAHQCYAHIAPFVRSALFAQQHALFRTLACSIETVLEERSENLWISTSGLGVPWVHVRLDSFPKYYQHAPYARLSV